MRNLQFLLGFGTAMLMTTKQGHEILRAADSLFNKATDAAIETLKEAMPATTEIVETTINTIIPGKDDGKEKDAENKI